MSVRRRQWSDPNGSVREAWIVDILFHHSDGRTERIRKAAPVSTKRAAEQYERELRQSLLTGTYRRKEELAEIPTLESFSIEFIQTYARTNNKPSEVVSKEITFRVHLLPQLGRLRLDQIGQRDIERYKSHKLDQGLAPKTINNHLTVLRRTLSVAAEWELIKFVPPVKWLATPDPDFDFLDFAEADRLLAAAKAEPEWHAMIMVGLRAGLRQGELLALRWEDVDLVAGRLMVRRNVVRGVVGTPKNGRSRTIDISPATVAMLKGHRHLRGESVFCDTDGKMLTKGACKHPLWRICRRAGLRRVGWHTLRHTFASHLVMRGVPIKVVQELLGHATIEMTMRYAHLSPDARRQAVELLDRPVNGHGTWMAHGGGGFGN